MLHKYVIMGVKQMKNTIGGLPMTTAVTIAEFRKDLRRLMDAALTGREIICLDAKSKDRQTCSLIKTNLLLDMLKAYSFHPEVHYDEETKTHNIHLDELKLYAYADTPEEAKEQIIDLAIDYAKDYINRLELFLNVPDRKTHYPCVIRLAHCKDREEVKKLIFGS